MALGKCRECDHTLSTTATACPNCGSTMKALTPKQRKVRCNKCEGQGYVKLVILGRDHPYRAEYIRSKYFPAVKGDSKATECFDCDGKGSIIETYFE